LSEQRSQRMERLFLEHVYRWLKPGGVLVLVIPAQRIGECSSVLSAQFAMFAFTALPNPRAFVMDRPFCSASGGVATKRTPARQRDHSCQALVRAFGEKPR